MKTTFISILFLFISFNHLCFAQIQSMGFTKPIVTPPSVYYKGYTFRPKLKLFDDTLYVCSNTGVYKKNLKDNTDWELYAFENIPIVEFVKNGNKLLAISMGTEDGTDSLLFLSNDNGQTFTNFTSPHFLESAWGYNHLFRIAQNPENSNSLLVLDFTKGISKSDDFGMSWKFLTYRFGYQDWDLAFHPLDTTTLFHTGETINFEAVIGKSSDNGETWSIFTQPNRTSCYHSIAFHPTNPDILVCSDEGAFGKSTNKGETFKIVPPDFPKIYVYKVLFDEKNSTILYASGATDKLNKDTIFIYRSTDTGDSWQLFYNEYVGTGCGPVLDMIKYKNKLILYTRDCGLFELKLDTIVETYLISVNVNNDEYGTATGGGTYETNTTATVTATAYTSYKFVNWTKNDMEISTENPYSFTVTEDVALVANFEKEVGMENIEIAVIKIYPNPTTGKLRIESGELKVEKIEIFDIYGRTQKAESKKQKGKILMDISELPVGVYFLLLTTEQGEVVKKVLKE